METDKKADRAFDGLPTSFEIPNITIAWISVIYLLVQTTGTFLSKYITTNFQRDSNKYIFEAQNHNFEIQRHNFEIQILQRVLELDNLKDRKASLSLLIKVGLFNNLLNNELTNFVDSSRYIPKWTKRPIEPFNSYIYIPKINLNINSQDVESVFETVNPGDTNNTTSPGKPGKTTSITRKNPGI